VSGVTAYNDPFAALQRGPWLALRPGPHYDPGLMIGRHNAGGNVGSMKAYLLAAAAVLAAPACAADGSIGPLSGSLDAYTFTLGGEAQGSLMVPDLPSAPGFTKNGATGAADLHFQAERDYDSGLSLALKSSFEVARDKLSYDNYGGDLVQKVYLQAQTGLGRVEIGMADGAAYALSVTGPVVDDATSLDNANAAFFLDPSTHQAFTGVFGLSSGVEASLNYAKLSYYTPRLFGLQLAVSYTPSEGKEVIPFLNNGPDLANRQKGIWEGALSYSETFGRTSVGLYGGVSLAHGTRKTPGHAGLTEWGLGSEIDYELSDDLKLAFGGGYRRSNSFAFDIYDVRTSGITESGHLSSTLSWKSWIVGAEYGSGTADGGDFGPVIGVRGVQASLGYVIDDNWQVTAGWQRLRYSRDSGAFYDGSQHLQLSAGFLHLKFKV
jgi:hypothetical protein